MHSSAALSSVNASLQMFPLRINIISQRQKKLQEKKKMETHLNKRKGRGEAKYEIVADSVGNLHR